MTETHKETQAKKKKKGKVDASLVMLRGKNKKSDLLISWHCKIISFRFLC